MSEPVEEPAPLTVDALAGILEAFTRIIVNTPDDLYDDEAALAAAVEASGALGEKITTAYRRKAQAR